MRRRPDQAVLFWFGVALVARAFVGSASADDLNRSNLEHQLETMLRNGTYSLRSVSSEGKQSFINNTVWGNTPVPPQSFQTSEVTAQFDGCVLKIHLEKPRFCERGIGDYGSTDTVIDLHFLEGKGRLSPPSDGYADLGAAVRYTFKEEIAARLRDLSSRASKITQEGMDRFPSDVPDRLRWYANKFDGEINGGILTGAHEQTNWCPGYAPAYPEPPLDVSETTFYVDPEHARQFAGMMDQYRERFCSGLD